LPDRRYEVQPGHFRLDVPGVARYSVEDGKSILIEPMADSTPEKIRLFLLGSTMGALLTSVASIRCMAAPWKRPGER